MYALASWYHVPYDLGVLKNVAGGGNSALGEGGGAGRGRTAVWGTNAPLSGWTGLARAFMTTLPAPRASGPYFATILHMFTCMGWWLGVARDLVCRADAERLAQRHPTMVLLWNGVALLTVTRAAGSTDVTCGRAAWTPFQLDASPAALLYQRMCAIALSITAARFMVV